MFMSNLQRVGRPTGSVTTVSRIHKLLIDFKSDVTNQATLVPVHIILYHHVIDVDSRLRRASGRIKINTVFE